MCYFMFVGIAADKAPLLEKAVRRGLAISPENNPSVMEKLPKEFNIYVITSGMCFCGLFQEAANPVKGLPVSDLRHKYEKKGWSKARIERAIAQSGTAYKRAASKARENDFEGIRPDLRDLLAGVAEAVGVLAIVVHFFDGPIEEEKFAIEQTGSVSPDSLRLGMDPLEVNQLLFVQTKVKRNFPKSLS